MAGKCGDRVQRLEIVGTPYQLFPMIYAFNLKLFRVFLERPTSRLNVNEASRFDFNEALLPEDS